METTMPNTDWTWAIADDGSLEFEAPGVTMKLTREKITEAVREDVDYAQHSDDPQDLDDMKEEWGVFRDFLNELIVIIDKEIST
jgi:hypothetical protein